MMGKNGMWEDTGEQKIMIIKVLKKVQACTVSGTTKMTVWLEAKTTGREREGKDQIT